MQSHKKLKMFLLKRKKDNEKKQPFKYNNEKGEEKTVEFYNY